MITKTLRLLLFSTLLFPGVFFAAVEENNSQATEEDNSPNYLNSPNKFFSLSRIVLGASNTEKKFNEQEIEDLCAKYLNLLVEFTAEESKELFNALTQKATLIEAHFTDNQNVVFDMLRCQGNENSYHSDKNALLQSQESSFRR